MLFPYSLAGCLWVILTNLMEDFNASAYHSGPELPECGGFEKRARSGHFSPGSRLDVCAVSAPSRETAE
jgi:hypothetical protein